MYVYLVRCNDSSYYIGVTNNYERRMAEHQVGNDSNCYTYKRLPIKLMYVEAFDTITDAIAREKQLKKWSRAKKEALIAGDENALQRLARSHGSAGSP